MQRRLRDCKFWHLYGLDELAFRGMWTCRLEKSLDRRLTTEETRGEVYADAVEWVPPPSAGAGWAHRRRRRARKSGLRWQQRGVARGGQARTRSYGRRHGDGDGELVAWRRRRRTRGLKATGAMEDTGRPGLAGRTLPNGRKQYYAGRAPQPAGEVGEGPGDVARGRASSSSTPAGRPDARVPAGAAGRGRAKVVGRRCGSPGIGRPLPASATMKEERGAAERLCRRRNRVRVGTTRDRN
jgi:hypothetical protein